MQHINVVHYATLEAHDKFIVTIVQIGSRFKLTYDDRRDLLKKVQYSKIFETQGAADQFIAQYAKLKEREQCENPTQPALVE